MIGSQVINTAQLDDSKATVVIPESELNQLGNYTISVVYSTGTDTNYTANSTEYTFEVTKWDVVYTIDVNDFLLGQDVVLDITVNKDVDCLAELTENFTVVIKDSNNQTVNTTSVKLVDGVKSSFTYNITTAGEYTLEVSYAGDDQHFANSTSDVFNVRDLAGNLTIVVDSVNYPDRAVAVVNASVDGNYRVYIKDIDRNYTVEVKNGLGNVTLDVLAADVTYEAHVVSLMEDYVAFNNKTTFTVNKGTIKAKFTINDVAYGNNVTVVVEDATADGVYNITYGSEVLANVTVVGGQGSANFAIDKAVGQYTFKLIAPTNINFTNSAGEVNQTTFNVTNATIVVTVSVDDVKYLESILVVVTASVDGNYEIYIDGVDTTKYVKVEDGKGNETVALGTAYGVKTYNLTVNLTKDNYDPAGANTTFTVNKADIIFNVDVEGYTYGATGKVGTLTTSVDGSAGKGYAIYIDDVNTVNITSSGNTFDVSGLDAGTHTVKVVPIADDPNFANYNVGETVFNTTTFEVKKAEITLDVSVDKVTYPGNAIVKITTDAAGNYTVTAGTVTKEVTLESSPSAQNVEIEGLDVGQYTATVTSKNSNYTETTKSADFVVVNGTLSDITASVVVADVSFATQPVAVVTSNVDGTFTVTVNGKPYTVVVKDGEGNTTISELLYVGNYPVKLTGDIEGYNPFLDETVSFNVNPADVGLTIEINSVTYPGKAVATVSANASGVYNITVDGHVYTVTIETAPGTMASAECTLDVLSAKTHTATVKKVNADGNFTADAQNETDFTVSKGTPVIIIEVGDSYDALDNVIINVTVPYGTGNVQVLDGSTPVGDAAALVDNATSVTISNIKGLGPHTIFVQLSGDGNYSNSYNFTTFEVTKITTGLNITDNKPVYEDEVIITFNLTGLVDGTAPRGQITIGDEVRDATSETITVNLGRLAAGDYTINITYTGDPTDANTVYGGCAEEYKFTVEKFTPSVNAVGVNAVYPNSPAVEFTGNRTGNFTIDIIDSEGNVVQTIDFGILENTTGAGVHIDNLTVGKYTANVTFIGNDNYTSVTNTTEFNVLPGEVTFDVNVTGGDYPAQAVVDVVASEDGIYNITVFDDNATVVFNQTGSLVAGEIASVELSLLDAGNYTVNVTYENGNYTVNPVQKDLTINKGVPEITIVVTDATYPEQGIVNVTSSADGEYTLTVGTFNATGNFTANETVSFTVDLLDVNTYDVIVVYAENDNYNKTNATDKLNVIKGAPEIIITVTDAIYPERGIVNVTCSADGNYTLTVGTFNATGNFTANETVSFTLDTLAADTYDVTVVYDENDNYNETTKTGKLVISKCTPVINITVDTEEIFENATLTIEIPYATGNVVSLNSEDVELIDGVATYNIGILDAQTYTFTAAYAGDDNLTFASATKTFTVGKLPSNLSLSVKNTTYGINPEVVITLDNKDDSDVDLYVDGVYTETIRISKGQYTGDIKGLHAGNHNFTVAYKGSAVYGADTQTAYFKVDKANVTLSVSAIGGTYPDPVSVTVKADVSGEYNLTFGTTTQVVNLEAGVAKEITYSDLAANNYIVTLFHVETQDFNSVSLSADATVAKANITITANAKDVTYPGDVTVTVKSDVGGKYTVALGTTSKDVTLEAGVANDVVFNNMPADSYVATVTFADTENYTSTSATANVVVRKANVIITVGANGVTYPGDVTVSVSSDVAGDYKVTIGKDTKSVTLKAGEAQNVIFEGLGAGSHTITVDYAETANYNAASATSDVNVAKATSSVVITPVIGTVTYPGAVDITYTESNGVAVVTVKDASGASVEASVSGGVISLTGLAAGNYTVSAVIAGNDNVTGSSDEITFNVAKATSSVAIAPVIGTVTYPGAVDITYTESNGVAVVTVKDASGASVEASVSGGVISLTGLAAGNYMVSAVIADTANVTGSSDEITFTVSKVENTTVTVEASSPLAGENATVTVTLPADATGTVTVRYGDGIYTAEVSNGTATISVPTNVAGTATASVTYSGDDNYASASSDVAITVKANGKVIAGDIKRGVNSPYDYLATLVDNEGKAMSGVELTFTINGKTYTATTNASGVATVSAGLGLVNDKDTKYDVIVTNPYTLENTTATTTIVPRLIVVSGDLTADYLENPPYIVQAIGDDGNPVGEGEVVQVIFAGFGYNLTTNATGHVVRTIGLAPGQYAVKACYAGYNTTATVFKVKQVMKVTSGTLKKTANSYTLKATLKSSNGKALADKEVTFTFNGKKYTVKTDSKGVASYTIKSSIIKKLKAGKTYTLYARYVNDVVKGKIKVVSK